MEYVLTHSALDFVLIVLIAIVGWFGKKGLDLLIHAVSKLDKAVDDLKDSVSAMKISNVSVFSTKTELNELAKRVDGISRSQERTAAILDSIEKRELRK